MAEQARSRHAGEDGVPAGAAVWNVADDAGTLDRVALAPGRVAFIGGVGRFLQEALSLPPPVIVASVMSSLLGLALPLALLQVYDRILPNRAVETLILLTAGLAATFLLDAAFRVIRGYLLGWHAMRTACRTQVDAAARLLTAPPDTVDAEPAMVWADSMDAVRQLGAFECGQARLLALDIPLAGLFVVVIALVGGPLVLVPAVLIAATAFFGVCRSNMLERTLARATEQGNRKQDFLVDCLAGISTVKGLAMEPLMMRRFERLQAGTARTTHDTILIGNQLQATGFLFASIMMVAVVSAGALLVMDGRLSVGGLACCTLLAGRLTQPAMRGIGVLSEFQNVRVARERAARLQDLPVAEPEPGTSGRSGAVRLDRVSVRYAEAGEPVLDRVSLDIRPGDFVGVTGEEGSGRTTLLRLISGEIEPSAGHAEVGKAGGPGAGGGGVAYVSSRSAIFRGSIIENIAMFRDGEARDRAVRAARLIGLDAELHRLPDGYDTPIGRGAAHLLPPGIIQRILIARGIAMDPAMLLIDGAGSVLDFEAETAMMRGLQMLRGRTTIVLVSDRPSVLSLADRVFRLEQGRLLPVSRDAPLAAFAEAAE